MQSLIFVTRGLVKRKTTGMPPIDHLLKLCFCAKPLPFMYFLTIRKIKRLLLSFPKSCLVILYIYIVSIHFCTIRNFRSLIFRLIFHGNLWEGLTDHLFKSRFLVNLLKAFTLKLEHSLFENVYKELLFVTNANLND